MTHVSKFPLDAATMSAASSHPEDAATLWVTIGGKCPLIIIITIINYLIGFDHVGVMEIYDNSNYYYYIK